MVRGTAGYGAIYLQDGATLLAGAYYHVYAWSGTSTLSGLVSCYDGSVYTGATLILTQYSSLSATA